MVKGLFSVVRLLVESVHNSKTAQSATPGKLDRRHMVTSRDVGATGPQKRLLKELGVAASWSLTKAEASRKINKAKSAPKPATPKQLEFLKSLGAKYPSGITSVNASRLIGATLKRQEGEKSRMMAKYARQHAADMKQSDREIRASLKQMLRKKRRRRGMISAIFRLGR